MDISTFNKAKLAYNAKSWDSAVILFSQCGTGPGTGEACHLCGNALMRLGRVQEASQAYRAATADTEYRNQGAVYTNLGKAQMALGDYRGAIDSLRHALSDASYQGAYKAYIALGEAYSKMGDARNAGVAFRKAALEENNPDPAKALINLGVCFMQLRRPADAAEAYRTALDFSTSDEERCLLNANLGQAFVASNRMLEAVQAFEAAMSGGYQLSPSAQADYERAVLATNARSSQARANEPYGAASAYNGVPVNDPLDPTGASGEILPSPDTSGFFAIPDSAIDAAAQAERKAHHSHTGIKVLIIVLVVIVVLAVLAVVAYIQGYGIPTQERTIETVFASEDASEIASAWSSSVSSEARDQTMTYVHTGSAYEITGMDMATNESTAVVDVTLPEGGTLTYLVSMVRDGIGWKISNIEEINAAVTDDTYDAAFIEEIEPAVEEVAEENPDEEWIEETTEEWTE